MHAFAQFHQFFEPYRGSYRWCNPSTSPPPASTCRREDGIGQWRMPPYRLLVAAIHCSANVMSKEKSAFPEA